MHSIIKHSKTVGPRPVPTPAPINLKLGHTGLLVEDYRYIKFDRDRLRNDGETLRETLLSRKIKKKNNKKQNKNRKVFRRSRQTLITE